MTEMFLSDFIDFNPTVRLPKGTVASFVPMDSVIPWHRDVVAAESKPYTGGTKFLDGDVLLARITPSLENGKTSIYRAAESARTEPAFGSTEFIVARGIEGISDTEYIYYLLRTDQIRSVAIASMTGSSGRQRVQLDTLESTLWDLSDLVEQRAIAATLGALDDKIESNNKKHEKIESLVGHLFMKLIDEGQEANRMGTLGELGEIVAGSTPRRSNSEYWTTKGIAWITPKDLSVQGLKFISHGANDITDLGYASTSTRLIPSGSVLFSSRAPIGYTAVALNQLCTNQGFKSIVPNENIGTAFTYCTLKLLTPTIEKYAGGSTFKEISASAMRGIACVIPSLNLIKNFDSRAKELFDLQASLERQNAILASLRDALLPELMSGRIRVPEA